MSTRALKMEMVEGGHLTHQLVRLSLVRGFEWLGRFAYLGLDHHFTS